MADASDQAKQRLHGGLGASASGQARVGLLGGLGAVASDQVSGIYDGWLLCPKQACYAQGCALALAYCAYILPHAG